MSAGNHIIFNPDTRSFEELKLVFRDNISISDPDFSDHINETRATMTSDIFTTGDDSTSSEEDEQDLTEVDDDDDDDDEEEDINIEVEGTSGLGEEGGLSATDLRQHARNRSNTFKKERPLSLPLQNAFVDQRLARGLLPEVDSPLFEASKTFVSIGVLKQGYLTKLGAIVKNWKRRWCVLIDEHLNYYKTPKVSAVYEKGRGELSAGISPRTPISSITSHVALCTSTRAPTSNGKLCCPATGSPRSFVSRL